MELNKTTTRFVANGHQRWSAAREEKIRAAVRENEPVGFFGKIRRWFKIEAGILHGQKGNEKSSPKILW